MSKRTKASFRPVIPLIIKDKIVDDLGKGVNRKIIADTYAVSQSLLTHIKQAMPLFCYCSNRKSEDA